MEVYSGWLGVSGNIFCVTGSCSWVGGGGCGVIFGCIGVDGLFSWVSGDRWRYILGK